MGSSRLLGIMTMLLIVLLPMAAKGSIFDGFLDKVCDQVECGKGSCVVNKSYPLNYICECESGWKRTQDDDDKYATSFLPCVIPKCSLNSSCLPASAPVPVPGKNFPFPSNQPLVSRKSFPYPPNFPAFDACNWATCGEGTCVKNKTFTYSCECSKGHYNLLNNSAFPCYSSECVFGYDCSKIGIKVGS